MSIVEFDLEKLREDSKKVFHKHLVDIVFNIYSPICAEIRVDSEHIMGQDIKSLKYYGYNVSLIAKTRTGFAIHVNNIQEKRK